MNEKFVERLSETDWTEATKLVGLLKEYADQVWCWDRTFTLIEVHLLEIDSGIAVSVLYRCGAHDICTTVTGPNVHSVFCDVRRILWGHSQITEAIETGDPPLSPLTESGL